MNWRIFIIGLLTYATMLAAEPVDTNWAGTIVHPVKDEATHAMLRSLIDEKDPVAREEAVRALANIHDANDAGLVRTRLLDSHPGVRLAAVQAAGGLGLSLSPEELEKLTHDAEPGIRAALVTVLPTLAVPGKLDTLKQGLSDVNPLVRRAAADAAPDLPGSIPYLQERWATETDGPAACAMFRAMCRAGGPGPDRIRLLQQALANEHPAVVAEAVGMATSDENEALGGLILEKLNEAAVVVQQAAVQAMARLKLADGVPQLLEMLDEADAALRPAICHTLGVIAGSASTQALTKRLADDPDLFTQRAAAGGLLMIHTDAAREALVLMLDSPRMTTRRETIRVLGQWKQPALALKIHPLLDDPEPEVAAAAAEALGRLRNPASRAPLLERLEEGPAAVQERVAWALGQFRAKEAVEQLSKLLWSKNESLEATCAEALGLIGDRSAWPDMHKMLYEMLQHGSLVRVKTIEALQRMGDKEIAPRVFQIVTEKVIPPTPMMPLPTYDATPVRIAALQFLTEHGDAATGEKLLIKFEETPPQDMRPSLAETVTRLTGRVYRPIPDESHTIYSVESLGPVPYPPVPPNPGIRLVE